MLISSSLPTPLNSGRLPLTSPQRDHTSSGRSAPFPEPHRQEVMTTNKGINQFRFILPDNATSRSGKMALREYQMIQNGGGPELMSRIDVRV